MLTHDWNERVFRMFCSDTVDAVMGTNRRRMNKTDWDFLDEITEMAEILQVGVELGIRRKKGLLRLLEQKPQRRRAPRQAYFFCYRTVHLHQQGYGYRTIARRLHRSKANVERNIKEFKEGTYQLGFDFLYSLPYDVAPFNAPKKGPPKVQKPIWDENQLLLPILLSRRGPVPRKQFHETCTDPIPSMEMEDMDWSEIPRIDFSSHR